MEPVWLALVVVGALNWLLVGLFDWNLVAEIFGTGTVTDVIYMIVGLAGADDAPAAARGLPPRHAPHARPTGALAGNARRTGGAHPADGRGSRRGPR